MEKILKLIACITLCEGVGIVSSIFTLNSIPTWYVYLNKPAFSPPNWVFGPVWTVMYILMGIAFYQVWTLRTKKKTLQRSSLQLFIIQLAVNFLWTFIFFGLRSPVGGLIDIIILWIFILLTLTRFYKLSKIAGYLMAPYLLWVSFATILNFSVAFLNK